MARFNLARQSQPSFSVEYFLREALLLQEGDTVGTVAAVERARRHKLRSFQPTPMFAYSLACRVHRDRHDETNEQYTQAAPQCRFRQVVERLVVVYPVL